MNTPDDCDLPLEETSWAALAAPKPDPTFVLALRKQTSGLVRSRARPRRWRVAAGLAAAYVVGVASALAWPRGGPPLPPAEQQAGRPKGAPRAATQPPVEVAALDPELLRRKVGGAPRAEQIRLLRLAGDRYLYDASDVRAALDCYRQVVELTPDEKLPRPDPDDNWLLAELKLSAAAKVAMRSSE